MEKQLTQLPPILQECWQVHQHIDDAIKAQEWEQVNEKASQRDQLIRAFFADWNQTDEFLLVSRFLEQLRDQVIEQSETMLLIKKSALNKVVHLKSSFNAAQTYQTIASHRS